MAEFEQVFAAIDIQGFQIGKKFYARELAIVNGEIETSIELLPDVNMSNKFVRKFVSYQTRNIHGLSVLTVDKNAPSSNHLEAIVYSLYQTLYHNSKQYFLCKNFQLERVLDKLRIPYKTHAGILADYKYDICLNHTEVSCNTSRLRCSYKKARSLWDLIGNGN